MTDMLYSICRLLPLLLMLSLVSPGSNAHGNVTVDDDLCLIRIGFYQAHFKIYLPRVSGHREYCEDIPWGREAVFVMEYSHGDLGGVPMDFRIIRDVTGMGRFATLEDVRQIDDIEAATVFYQPPTTSPDVYTVMHEFEERGQYLGIVTAPHPEGREQYVAVFPFKVGYTRLGLLPLFLLLLLVAQGLYWYSTRRNQSPEEESS